MNENITSGHFRWKWTNLNCYLFQLLYFRAWNTLVSLLSMIFKFLLILYTQPVSMPRFFYAIYKNISRLLSERIKNNVDQSLNMYYIVMHQNNWTYSFVEVSTLLQYKIFNIVNILLRKLRKLLLIQWWLKEEKFWL